MLIDRYPTPDAAMHRHPAKRRVYAIACLCVAITIAAACLSICLLRRDQIKQQMSDASGLATVLAAQAARTIQAVGTAFDVDRQGTAVEVAVSDGVVVVSVPGIAASNPAVRPSDAATTVSKGYAVAYEGSRALGEPRAISYDRRAPRADNQLRFNGAR